MSKVAGKDKRKRSRGYYKMAHGWQDHPIFGDEPFSKRDAWCWLIDKARHRDTYFTFYSRKILVRRGQYCASTREMARAWKWSEAKVRRWLRQLQGDAGSDALIDAQSDAGKTLVTICNYDLYQGEAGNCDAPFDAPSDAGSDALKKKDIRNIYPPPWSPPTGTEIEPGFDNPKPTRKTGEKNGKSRAKRATRLSPDWRPDERDREYATDHGLTHEDIEFEHQAFLDHWCNGSGHTKAHKDWGRTWKNWVRRAAKQQRPRAHHPSRGNRGQNSSVAAAVRDLLAETDYGA